MTAVARQYHTKAPAMSWAVSLATVALLTADVLKYAGREVNLVISILDEHSYRHSTY